jgi:hypothetical protein
MAAVSGSRRRLAVSLPNSSVWRKSRATSYPRKPKGLEQVVTDPAPPKEGGAGQSEKLFSAVSSGSFEALVQVWVPIWSTVSEVNYSVTEVLEIRTDSV